MTPVRLTIQPVTIVKRGKPVRLPTPPTHNARLHWADKARQVKAWRKAAWAACLQVSAPRCSRATIVITRHSVREMDDDNLHSCVKPILDGIVDAKVVPDDKGKHVDLEVLQMRVKHFDEERFEVMITPIE